jgi:hypothetical protein
MEIGKQGKQLLPLSKTLELLFSLSKNLQRQLQEKHQNGQAMKKANLVAFEIHQNHGCPYKTLSLPCLPAVLSFLRYC